MLPEPAEGVVSAKAAVRIAVKRTILGRLGANAVHYIVRAERINKMSDGDVHRPFGTPVGTPAADVAAMCYLQGRLIQRRRRVPRARPIWDVTRLQSSSDDSDVDDSEDSE